MELKFINWILTFPYGTIYLHDKELDLSSVMP